MKNKVKYIVKSFLLATFVLTAIFSCATGGYNEDVVDQLITERVLSPLELTGRIRNQTSVELTWTVGKKVDHYVVEFSPDDTSFSNPSKVLNVLASELPLTVQLAGETLYSIRVKAISSVGLEDSKWSVIQAQTLTEQIYLPVQNGDIQAKSALFRWTPNSEVTKIVLTPGDIEHIITDAEKIAGVATVTGLESELNYTATLFNNTKRRGVLNITTLVDPSSGIVLQPTDDLSAKIAAAPSGTLFLLSPGNYTVNSGEIGLTKSITIRGLYPYDKPLLHVKFKLNAGSFNFSLIDLDLSGYDAGGIIQADSYLVNLGTATNVGDILINGCNVHDFQRSLMYASVASAKVKSFTVVNSVVTNVNTTAGADFIDFRATYIQDIVIKTSTFNNCSPGRDFVRVDAGTFTGQGLNTNVLLDESTFYNVSNLPGTTLKRILYVRAASNSSSVKNCIFAKTNALHSNQAATTIPSFANNNYFDAPSFSSASITSNKPDTTGSTLDPEFKNAATGDFTLGNGTLIDNQVGDPRWRK